MNRVLALALALSIGANVGFVVRFLDAPPEDYPQRPPHAKRGRPSLVETLDRHLERLSRGLGLDAGQRADLRRAHDALFPAIRAAHRDIEQQRDAVARAFVEAVGTPGAFRDRVRALQQSRAVLDSLLTEVLLAEMAVLNPDQRDRYIETSPWSRRLRGGPGGGPPPRPPFPPKGGPPPH